MSNKIFMLSAVCAATLAVMACGGGNDFGPGPGPVAVAPPASTAIVTAPVTPVITAPIIPAPVVAAPVVTAPVVIAPVVIAPVPTAPVVVAPVVTAPAPTGIITNLTGAVIKGPVGNATVTAKKPDGTACGTTATNTTGQYAFTTSCTGDVIIEVTGGTYLDEATNATKALDTPLKSVITANGGTVNGVVTPLTTMAFSYAFTSNNAVSKAAFDAQAVKIAAQFGLAGVNLGTTVPVVTGTADAYGNALKGISQYLSDNPTQNLAAVTTASFKSALDVTSFSSLYTTAFNKINGTNITLSFEGGAFNFSGTGAGGGSGTCGISLVGTTTTAGYSVPVNLDVCVSGLVGSCDAGNSTVAQYLTTISGQVAGANITTTYSAVCKAGAIPFVIK